MTDHERSQLTPTGEARREQMLDELLTQAGLKEVGGIVHIFRPDV